MNVVACSPATTDSDEGQTNIQPVKAEAGPNQSRIVGRTVMLNASESTGTGISYFWTLRSKPAGSNAKLLNFEKAYPTFEADLPGSYVAQLIVIDSANGTSKDFTTVTAAANSSEANNQILIIHTEFKDNCQSCHNGVDASGRPIGHIETTEECAVCHSVVAWTPNINVDHNEVLGSCSTCHDGLIAPGKPATHIETTSECNLCHIAGTTFGYGNLPNFGIFDDHEDDHPFIGDLMCVDCHNNVIEEGKPADHIPASDTCENCHVTTDWEDGVSGGGTGGGGTPPTEEDDHPPIGSLMCFDCHNNIVEEGKPADHIPASDTCENCHVTTDWVDVASGGTGGGTSPPVAAGHPPIGTLMCVQCHTTKPANHILTTDLCEACHNTNGWVPPIAVDHTQVIGVCSSCHNNTAAQGKPAGHVITSSECDVCHNTTGWTAAANGSPAGNTGGVFVDHSSFTEATVCLDCHNGTTATGRPPRPFHIITSRDCDTCHVTTSWQI